jgi:hypothetical protein
VKREKVVEKGNGALADEKMLLCYQWNWKESIWCEVSEVKVVQFKERICVVHYTLLLLLHY